MLKSELEAEVKRLQKVCKEDADNAGAAIARQVSKNQELRAENKRLSEEKALFKGVIAKREEVIDKAYSERATVVAIAAAMARALGWNAGRGIDTDRVFGAEFSCVVYIDTPAGQISYHIWDKDHVNLTGMPVYKGEWDNTYLGKDPMTAVRLAAMMDYHGADCVLGKKPWEKPDEDADVEGICSRALRKNLDFGLTSKKLWENR